MKFTSEDLMKAMGLKVGDRIKVNQLDILEVKLNKENEPILYVPNRCIESIGIRGITNISLDYLINEEIEILPQPKRVGDLKCKDLLCNDCPIFLLNMRNNCKTHNNLYQTLNDWFEEHKDQEIYGILKARLDKEVEDND